MCIRDSQQSSRWKVFVANRVAEIQRLATRGTWYHVTSLDNPADILSRGCLPRILHNHPQWWHGPSWLSHESSSWPISAFDIHSPCTYPDLEQEQCKQVPTSLIVALSNSSYVENYSSLTRLIRVFSYCRRFIRNSRLPVADRETSFLSAQELHDTLLVFIRQSQQLHFGIEVKELEEHRCIPNSSKILSLNPFLDESGILLSLIHI